MAHPKWQAELYPLFDSTSRWILPDGNVTRFQHTYKTRRDALAASKKFKKGKYAGMVFDHELFIDKVGEVR